MEASWRAYILRNLIEKEIGEKYKNGVKTVVTCILSFTLPCMLLP
jgi:hypothetical protein